MRRTFAAFVALMTMVLGLTLVTASPANALLERRECRSGGEEAGICVSIFKTSANVPGNNLRIERIEVYSYGDESGLERCPAIEYRVSVLGRNGAKWARSGVLGCGDYHKNYDTEVVVVPFQDAVLTTAHIRDNGGFDSSVQFTMPVHGCNPCPV